MPTRFRNGVACMAKVNRHGLKRSSLSSDVKRKVRQACGFGCVVCGGALIQYEHVAPTFADATQHEPDKMALLCPGCHDQVTRGYKSKARVLEAMADPFCKRKGFSSEVFELGKVVPTIVFAGVQLRECSTPLRIHGIRPFTFSKGSEAGEPVLFSGAFFNSDGQLSLEVEENEWRPQTTNWDVDCSGGALVIRDSAGHVSLRASFKEPGAVVIEQLDMLVPGARLLGSRDGLQVQWLGGGTVHLSGHLADGYEVGLELTKDGGLIVGTGGTTAAFIERAKARAALMADPNLCAEINALCDQAEACFATRPDFNFVTAAPLRHALLRLPYSEGVDQATGARRAEMIERLSFGMRPPGS